MCIYIYIHMYRSEVLDHLLHLAEGVRRDAHGEGREHLIIIVIIQTILNIIIIIQTILKSVSIMITLFILLLLLLLLLVIIISTMIVTMTIHIIQMIMLVI